MIMSACASKCIVSAAAADTMESVAEAMQQEWAKINQITRTDAELPAFGPVAALAHLQNAATAAATG